MLMERHQVKKARNAKKKHHLKEPSKRTEEDDKRFEESLGKTWNRRDTILGGYTKKRQTRLCRNWHFLIETFIKVSPLY